MPKKTPTKADDARPASASKKPALESHTTTQDPRLQGEDDDELEFEEPFPDEFEEEEIVEKPADDEDMDVVDASHETPNHDEEDDQEPKTTTHFFRPDVDADNQEMEHDPSAYAMLHRLAFTWPALSFDFLIDHLGVDRTRYPMSVYLVAGSQAENPQDNSINMLRLNQLGRTKRTLDQEEDDLMGAIANDDSDDTDPTLENRLQPHLGAVNRIRAMPQKPSVVATWSETGNVHLFDLARPLQTLQLPCEAVGAWQVSTLTGHKTEGFALDWSPVRHGRLATGDCANCIIVWDAGQQAGNSLKFNGHTGSVEDLQWSPTEENVFASCSVDGNIKIWDVRAPQKTGGMLTEHAHDVDVNVISWNRKVSHLLASGSDDASFKVWDLRLFGKQQPVGWFKGFHQDAIVSIEWSPHEESVLTCASADNQVSVWDLALEEDREYARAHGDELAEDVLDAHGKPLVIPPQLLFVHAGVEEPKEVHFHPQVLGLIGVTGALGFDLFICEPLDPKSNLAND